VGLRGHIGTELQELQQSNNKSRQTKEVEMKEKQKRHGQVTVHGVLCELNVFKLKECNV
jgi:hypothetical protein